MKRVVAIQHVAGEPPGTIGDALAAAGLAVDVIRVDRGDAIPAELAADGLVVMGGPMGVYEADRYPHLTDELALLRHALARGVPVLGVCLGSQLVAAALGARVAPAPRKEVGWYDVTLEPGARGDALLGPAPARFPALHWHGDVFDLPAGATPLARSELTPLQAFRHQRAWGLLFHLEVSPAAVDDFVRENPADLAAAGVAAADVQAGARQHATAVETLGREIFGRWAALV
jgi:GMP synthase (glutamine-hydrolysing)